MHFLLDAEQGQYLVPELISCMSQVLEFIAFSLTFGVGEVLTRIRIFINCSSSIPNPALLLTTEVSELLYYIHSAFEKYKYTGT